MLALPESILQSLPVIRELSIETLGGFGIHTSVNPDYFGSIPSDGIKQPYCYVADNDLNLTANQKLRILYQVDEKYPFLYSPEQVRVYDPISQRQWEGQALRKNSRLATTIVKHPELDVAYLASPLIIGRKPDNRPVFFRGFDNYALAQKAIHEEYRITPWVIIARDLWRWNRPLISLKKVFAHIDTINKNDPEKRCDYFLKPSWQSLLNINEV